jgi:hypothetical protein
MYPSERALCVSRFLTESQMAVVSFAHTCDLCGKPCQAGQLTHLYGEPVFRAGFGALTRPRVDVCADCQVRPVREVVGLLATAR